MEIKNKLTVTIGVRGRGKWGKEGGESSRNKYKGPMDRDNGGED